MIQTIEKDAITFAKEMAAENTSRQVYLCHQVNCFGVMGGGIALQIKKEYPETFNAYKQFCDDFQLKARHIQLAVAKSQILGAVILVNEDDGVIVANVFSQYNYGRTGCYTDYDALSTGLQKVHNQAVESTAEHKPIVIVPYKIGCGLAGGSWNVVEPMLKGIFMDDLVDLYICKLPE